MFGCVIGDFRRGKIFAPEPIAEMPEQNGIVERFFRSLKEDVYGFIDLSCFDMQRPPLIGISATKIPLSRIKHLDIRHW